MKSRTDISITVGFVKISKGTNQLTYKEGVTGDGSQGAQQECNDNLSECTVSNLSPGRPYGITVTSCITGTSPPVCSDASDMTTVKTTPQGKTKGNPHVN